LKAIQKSVRALASDNRGATAVEYGLIVALIVIAMAGGLSTLGGGATGMWTKIQTEMQKT
jgi:pilus assembly protein Flp/PilA